MTGKQKQLITLITILTLSLTVGIGTNAMHIMEGYLPVTYCILWGVLCLPFLISGYLSIKKTIEHHRKALLILAMAGAYTFVLSALKIPSVTGSSSHMTGTGLGAILFGPGIMSILGIIVLLFQALLLAHGGLTTLGANTFSMAIAGPVSAWVVYHLAQKIRIPRLPAVFFAAMLGDLLTYCITALQLGIAYPAPAGGIIESTVTFLGIFAVTQIPLAVIEGLITAAVVIGLEAYAAPELRELGYLKKGGLINER